MQNYEYRNLKQKCEIIYIEKKHKAKIRNYIDPLNAKLYIDPGVNIVIYEINIGTNTKIRPHF